MLLLRVLQGVIKSFRLRHIISNGTYQDGESSAVGAVAAAVVVEQEEEKTFTGATILSCCGKAESMLWATHCWGKENKVNRRKQENGASAFSTLKLKLTLFTHSFFDPVRLPPFDLAFLTTPISFFLPPISFSFLPFFHCAFFFLFFSSFFSFLHHPQRSSFFPFSPHFILKVLDYLLGCHAERPTARGEQAWNGADVAASLRPRGNG